MRVELLTFWALPLTAVLLACAGGITEAEQRYKAGGEFQEQNRLEEAIVDYDEAIRLDPPACPGLQTPRQCL